MKLMTDMGLHEGGMENWVSDNAWFLFANKVQEKEREVVANWIMGGGFATGHGDSIVDLLDQLESQIAEKEREACATMSDWILKEGGGTWGDAIRARGQA
jgi:hypothetical protein